jgi:hypothetical protein
MIKMIGNGIPSSHNSNPRPMFHPSSNPQVVPRHPCTFDQFVGNAIRVPKRTAPSGRRSRCQARRQSYGIDGAPHRARFISFAGLLGDDREATLVHCEVATSPTPQCS